MLAQDQGDRGLGAGRGLHPAATGAAAAVAFDPDAIRGGKLAIQAERPTKWLSPCRPPRDLYGTMIAEGATKGILMTTVFVR